ncbi:MAG: flagellar hook-length control protein FliK [Alphaproteobacteria bacterium]|nr:flagellar hook-length control protein FliK [Alphaproteobacteria bacterium]
MAQLAQAKIQDTTTSTLSGLFSAAKANVSVSGSTSELFASLLTQAGASMPVVEAYDASSSTVAFPVSKDVSKISVHDSAKQSKQTTAAQTSREDGPATAKATLHEDPLVPAKSEPSEQEAPAQETSAKQDSQDDPIATKDEAAPTQDQMQAANEDEPTSDAIDQEMAALLASMVKPESQKNVAKTEDAPTALSLVADAGAGEDPTQSPDEELMGLAPLLTDEKAAPKTKATETGASAGTQSKAELSSLLAQAAGDTVAKDAGATEDLLEASSSVDEDAETTSQYTKMIDEATTAKVGNNKGAEQGNQHDFSDLAKGQDRATTGQDVNTLAGAAATNASSVSAQASNAAADGAVQATGGTQASQNVSSLATGARPVGSYDFASQLSAARVTKGGSTNLPQAVEQVAVQLHKAAKEGANEITIQLRPAELGKIEVKLEIAADKSVTGTVIADNQTTLNLLQKDSSSLQRALQEAGLQADSGCMQFSLRDDNQANQFAQNQSETWKSGLSVEKGLDDSEDLSVMTAATETYYLTPGRVNLRV